MGHGWPNNKKYPIHAWLSMTKCILHECEKKYRHSSKYHINDNENTPKQNIAMVIKFIRRMHFTNAPQILLKPKRKICFLCIYTRLGILDQ